MGHEMAITTEQDLEIALFTHGHDGPGLAKAFHTVLNVHPTNASLTLPKTVYDSPAAMQALLDAMDRHGTIKMDARWLGQVGLATAMHAKKQANVLGVPSSNLLTALGILTDAMHFSTLGVPAAQVKPRNHTWEYVQQNFDETLRSFVAGANFHLNSDFKLAPPLPIVEVKPDAGTRLLAGTAGRGGIPAGKVYCR